MKGKQFDLNETITEKFISAIESGTLPWRKPWVTASGNWMRPMNLISKKPYRGINTCLLAMSDYDSAYWLTFKQALEKKGNVKKGERGTHVVFYKTDDKKDAAGNIVYDAKGNALKSWLLRYYTVFNLAQCEGIENPDAGNESVPVRTVEPIADAERIAACNALPKATHGGDRAYYSPSLDCIRMPQRDSFDCAEAYYGTLFHEQVHATGHASRLKRKGIVEKGHSFGDHEYSKEELIAEIGASFVANEIGILDKAQFDNSAAYLAAWVKVLKGDSKLIVSASGHAQRAADLVLLESNPAGYAAWLDGREAR